MFIFIGKFLPFSDNKFNFQAEVNTQLFIALQSCMAHVQTWFLLTHPAHNRFVTLIYFRTTFSVLLVLFLFCQLLRKKEQSVSLSTRCSNSSFLTVSACSLLQAQQCFIAKALTEVPRISQCVQQHVSLILTVMKIKGNSVYGLGQ